jgi:hypothetical protein
MQHDHDTLCSTAKRPLACGLASIVVALFLYGAFFAAAPGFCRDWKSSATTQAVDYTQIRDNRGRGELILVWWVVPQWTRNVHIQQLLDQYVVIAVTHGKPSMGGAFTFENVDTLLVYAGSDTKPLTRVTGDSIPPILAGYLTTLTGVLRRSIGEMGEGMHFFVFDGDSVHACKPGGLAVPFANETYTFKTPIPGCLPG